MVMCGFVSVIFGDLGEQHFFGSRKIIVLVMITCFMIFFFSMTWFYIRLSKRKSWVVRYQNGVLDDVSKPFNKATGLSVEHIVSVNQWSRSKGINQYKIVTTWHHPKKSALMNQFKGNHFYLTDYVIDSKELFELLEQVATDCRKLTGNLN